MKTQAVIKKAVAAMLVAASVFASVPCLAFDYLIGDINRDSRINAVDAVLLAKIVAGSYEADGDPEITDINGDTKTNAADCLEFSNYLVGRQNIREYVFGTKLLEYGQSKRTTLAINDLLLKHGKTSPAHTGDEYAILDFDALIIEDPSIIYDTVLLYQLKTLSFGIERKELRAFLHDVCDRYGKEGEAEPGVTYSSLITGAYNHYRSLYSTYGPITPSGISEEKAEIMHEDDNWKSFCHELLMITKHEVSAEETLLFKSMTTEEAVNTVKRAIEFFRESPCTETVGGFSLTANIGGIDEYEEIFNTLYENDIDVWVTADEENEIVCGTLIGSGLSEYVTGVIGTTLPTSEAKIVTDDAEEGFPRRFINGNLFTEYTAIPGRIDSQSKAPAIDAVGSFYYRKGPLLTIFNSTNPSCSADFEDTELAIMLHGTESCKEIDAAIRQKNSSYKNTVKKSDTLFVLQEIDEDNCVLMPDLETAVSDTNNSSPVSDIIGERYHVYSYPDYFPITVGNDDSSIRAMTFNIRYKNDSDGHSISERVPRVKAIIDDCNPDVIGMQESTDEWLPYLYDMFSEEYEIYSIHRGEDDSEACPILFKKSEFKCLAKGAFWLSDTPCAPSGGWDPCNRICEFVKLLDIKSGKEIVFFNTHFGFTDKVQSDSSRLIIEYAEKFSDLPLLVCGDFNMHTDWPGYEVMTEYFSDVNMQTAKDVEETFHGYYEYDEPLEHIDYCFINSNFTPVFSETIRRAFDGKYPSDHYPVFFEIK